MPILNFTDFDDIPESLRSYAKVSSTSTGFEVDVSPTLKLAEFRERNIELVNERDGALAKANRNLEEELARRTKEMFDTFTAQIADRDAVIAALREQVDLNLALAENKQQQINTLTGSAIEDARVIDALLANLEKVKAVDIDYLTAERDAFRHSAQEWLALADEAAREVDLLSQYILSKTTFEAVADEHEALGKIVDLLAIQ
ncbi:hypothetical protein HOU02_gp121 [Caulobacter phage CcrBL9]|uniref:Uncharacterized protein n=1 Tax=Caulobacter phage CcrBL9 TaxID=2283270 RepID=A0A385EDQ6_9CAUD|nr:hypothetical protein HOU02_gp121 [Caulobacter phage CcrBL9]AXQ69145.1 hypothetical protein CcrBL9_gp121 [Caulobacter phage CcrBL9]